VRLHQSDPANVIMVVLLLASSPCSEAHHQCQDSCGQIVGLPNGNQISPPRRLNSYSATPPYIATVFTMAALATKTQSQNIFAKLKAKPANKVGLGKGGAVYMC